MKLSRQAGTTSQTVEVFIQDSTKTDGSGKTGLVFNTSGLTCYYVRSRAASVAVTLVTQTVTGAFSSGGFVEIDAANCPGLYRLDLPDAGQATGADHVVYFIKGTGIAPLPLEIELTGWNNQDGVRGGLTALPNVASGSAGAIITSGTGTAQLSVASGVASANATQINGVATTSVTTVNANVGTTQPVNFTGAAGSALVKGDAVDIGSVAAGSATVGAVTNLTNLPSIPAGWLTAAGIAAGALNGKGDWLVSSSYPTNFAALGISVTGHISNVDTLATYTGNTPQTGDSFARLGTPAGASIAADLAEIEAETDGIAAIPTTPAPTTAAIATAIWTDTTASDFSTVGSPGHILVTQLGGTFTTTGSSVFTVAALANGPSGSGSNPAAIATAIFTDLMASSDFSTAGSIGALLKANLDTNVGSRMATFSLPANFAAMGISAGGHVSNVDNLVANSDKTGYALTTAYDAAKTAAQAGNQMDLVNAPNATAITAIQSGLSKPGTAQIVDLTPVVPVTGNTPNSLADCLNAARAQGFGKWTISGTTLTLFAPDGSTTVRSFTLDSSSSPLSRT